MQSSIGHQYGLVVSRSNEVVWQRHIARERKNRNIHNDSPGSNVHFEWNIEIRVGFYKGIGGVEREGVALKLFLVSFYRSFTSASNGIILRERRRNRFDGRQGGIGEPQAPPMECRERDINRRQGIHRVVVNALWRGVVKKRSLALDKCVERRFNREGKHPQCGREVETLWREEFSQHFIGRIEGFGRYSKGSTLLVVDALNLRWQSEENLVFFQHWFCQCKEVEVFTNESLLYRFNLVEWQHHDVGIVVVLPLCPVFCSIADKRGIGNSTEESRETFFVCGGNSNGALWKQWAVGTNKLFDEFPLYRFLPSIDLFKVVDVEDELLECVLWQRNGCIGGIGSSPQQNANGILLSVALVW